MTSLAIEEGIDAVGCRETSLGRHAREVLLAVLLGGSLGLLLMQPWEPIPFPISDFGGWMTLLSSSRSATEGFWGLVVEHAREGRLNPLSMAYVAINWALFDMHALGWQLVRAAIMVTVVGTAYVLFRMLGARRGAALVGAGFFVITDSARSVWMLPQAVEHVATLFVLLASLLAASYHAVTRTWRSASATAALLVLATWVREPMVAAVPFVLLLALAHRGQGRLSRPRVERRSLILLSVIGLAVALLNVIPVIAVRFLERSTGYASRFGPENISLGNVTNVLSALMLPVTREPLFPANVVFVFVIATAAVGAGVASRRYRSMLLLAVPLPLCAAAIYVMWPSFPGNYALPYVPAIALVFALALTRLWDVSSAGRALAVGGASVVMGYGALLAVNGRREYAASRLLDVDMVAYVSAMSASQVIVAVDDPRVSGEFGRGLVLYASATRGGARVPASDVTCATAERMLIELPPENVLLRPPDACRSASLSTPTASLTRAATIRNWKTLRTQRWEITADIWHGQGGR